MMRKLISQNFPDSQYTIEINFTIINIYLSKPQHSNQQMSHQHHNHSHSHQHNHQHHDHHHPQHHDTHHHHHHHQHHHQIQGSTQKWQNRHPNYASIDSGPQTFFYTLTNMLKLSEAKNILQVGCGAGKLLSTVLDLKHPQAAYIATDKSEVMVKEAKLRLQAHFNKYQSKLTYEEWLAKQHLHFDVQDGQNILIKSQKPFDRIIANMLLCHANDPEKMLKNWHSIAEEDCLLGVSLLGDPQKNNFVRGMREAIVEAGEKLPEGNPPYHWYDKISKIVEDSGWEIVLEWDQNGLFPYLTLEEFNLKPLGHKNMAEKVKQIFEEKVVNKYLVKEKSGVQFWSKVIIARKRSNK